jgi:hypothetical protein
MKVPPNFVDFQVIASRRLFDGKDWCWRFDTMEGYGLVQINKHMVRMTDRC